MAKYLGMEVCAFSLVTNLAAGMTGKQLSHEEVGESITSLFLFSLSLPPFRSSFFFLLSIHVHVSAETAGKAAKSFEQFMKVFISEITLLPSSSPRIAPVHPPPSHRFSLPQPVPLARSADEIRQATASVAISLSLNVQEGRHAHSSSPSSSPELVVLYANEKDQIHHIVNFLQSADAKFLNIRGIFLRWKKLTWIQKENEVFIESPTFFFTSIFIF